MRNARVRFAQAHACEKSIQVLFRPALPRADAYEKITPGKFLLIGYSYDLNVVLSPAGKGSLHDLFQKFIAVRYIDRV